MAVAEISATSRPRAGKGAARQARRAGEVPAVIYGNKKDPTLITISANELKKLLGRGKFLSTVFDVKFDTTTERCLPRDVQFDPVMDFPLHVDFQRISDDGRIRVSVPVAFLNREISPGLKRGGTLNIVRHEIEVNCPADNIPAQFEVDLASVNIGTSIHISSVNLPEGVTPTITDRDFTVATVVGKGGKADDESEDESGGEEAAASTS
ncbi:MAG: 50S ribosomal protein L25/general stress protein Ctc [Pseudomonadota bacterium]